MDYSIINNLIEELDDNKFYLSLVDSKGNELQNEDYTRIPIKLSIKSIFEDKILLHNNSECIFGIHKEIWKISGIKLYTKNNKCIFSKKYNYEHTIENDFRIYLPIDSIEIELKEIESFVNSIKTEKFYLGLMGEDGKEIQNENYKRIPIKNV